MTVIPNAGVHAAETVGRQRIAAYGICRDAGGRILLVRAAPSTHLSGQWFLPGGGLGFGETPQEGLAREFVEETGLRVRSAALHTVLSDVSLLPSQVRVHTVRLIYLVGLSGGEPRAETEGSTDDVRWVPREEISDLLMADYARRALSGLD
ncbi:NUDIX hydrolase [Frankia sp. Cppng1_Ct_nod]|uniref:NUDIX hydrolase n=1 Tax=Frankia sp. Cppng1_Ct_nod TaxID=2897162 RepID=UPI0013EF8885|nr:NUDIX hydrolase [Frankia sp. Cppng1_Ct_nod]